MSYNPNAFESKLRALRRPHSLERLGALVEINQIILDKPELLSLAFPILLTEFFRPELIPGTSAALDPNDRIRVECACNCLTSSFMISAMYGPNAGLEPACVDDAHNRVHVVASGLWTWAEYLMIHGVSQPDTRTGDMSLCAALFSLRLIRDDMLSECLPEFVTVAIGIYVAYAHFKTVQRIVGVFDANTMALPQSSLIRLFRLCSSQSPDRPGLPRVEDVRMLLDSVRSELIPAVFRHLAIESAPQPPIYERIVQETQIVRDMMTIESFRSHPEMVSDTHIGLMVRLCLDVIALPPLPQDGDLLKIRRALFVVQTCKDYLRFVTREANFHLHLPRVVEIGLLTAIHRSYPWVARFETLVKEDPAAGRRHLGFQLLSDLHHFCEEIIMPHMWIYDVFQALYVATRDEATAAELKMHNHGGIILELLDRWSEGHRKIQALMTARKKCHLSRCSRSETQLKLCDGCRQFMFHDKWCQKMAWREHRSDCLPRTARGRAPALLTRTEEIEFVQSIATLELQRLPRADMESLMKCLKSDGMLELRIDGKIGPRYHVVPSDLASENDRNLLWSDVFRLAGSDPERYLAVRLVLPAGRGPALAAYCLVDRPGWLTGMTPSPGLDDLC